MRRPIITGLILLIRHFFSPNKNIEQTIPYSYIQCQTYIILHGFFYKYTSFIYFIIKIAIVAMYCTCMYDAQNYSCDNEQT